MKRWLPILLILLIAAALRLVALPSVPPGLQHDEVFHGHDAVTAASMSGNVLSIAAEATGACRVRRS